MSEFESPLSRDEAILQNMLGAENVLPPPQSRVEELLQEILEQGGGGTTVVANPEMPSGTTPTELENLQIGEDYYSVGGGTRHAYRHAIFLYIPGTISTGYSATIYLDICNNIATPYSKDSLVDLVKENGAVRSTTIHIMCTGEKTPYGGGTTAQVNRLSYNISQDQISEINPSFITEFVDSVYQLT